MKGVFTLTYLLSLAFFFASPVQAQPDPPDLTFGSVTAATFAPVVYQLDSNANAVYLLDHGNVTFDPAYTNQGYCIIFERHVRVRILNKNALDLATLSLSAFHRSNYSAYIDDVRGVTYNLEDGKVVATRLDKSSIFKDKNGYYDIEKIAFPNVREGSVIEYSFRIVYPGFGYIPEWQFQLRYPVLWSQYEVTAPVLFDYFVKTQGYRAFSVDTTLSSSASFSIRFMNGIGGNWSGPTVHRVWALQNVLPLEKREPYTTTLRNHEQKVQFQLSALHFDTYNKNYRASWPQLTDELLRNPNFGEALRDKNRWMDDQLRQIVTKDDHSVQAAQKLFAYVRDGFTSTGEGSIYLSQPAKKTWDDKKGTVADINLLLTAIYRHAGFEASPVLLSTREHGYPLYLFPLLNDYNYVITRVQVGGEYYLLDASRPTTGFGQLPEPCYNGMARAIDSSHDALPLLTDSVTEKRRTRVFLTNDSTGNCVGTYYRELGVFESMQLRSRLKQEKPADFFDNLRKSLADYKQMGEYGFDSLAVPEKPLGWHYDMTYHFTTKTVYFNPIMHERMTNSPLSNPVRYYPVEMPYRVDNSYVLSMEIPKGYAIDQLPKSVRYVLVDSTCSYEYMISTDGNNIDFHVRLRLGKTNYPVEQYAGLRDFFSLIVQKEKEPIIFKKIN